MWELDQCVETSFFKIHEQTQDDMEAAADTDDAPFPRCTTTLKDRVELVAWPTQLKPQSHFTWSPSFTNGILLNQTALRSSQIGYTNSDNSIHDFSSRFEPDMNPTLPEILSWTRWELCLTHRWREVRVIDGYIDPNLTIAHMTHNAAIISLHSRLAHPPRQARAWLSSLVSGASKEACVMASIKIDRIARRFLDASSGIPPHQFALCMYIAAKVLLCKLPPTAAHAPLNMLV